jgi:hypothetical protein
VPPPAPLMILILENYDIRHILVSVINPALLKQGYREDILINEVSQLKNEKIRNFTLE